MILTINGKPIKSDVTKTTEYTPVATMQSPKFYIPLILSIASILVMYFLSTISPVATIAYLNLT